jgi:hypothetical protein
MVDTNCNKFNMYILSIYYIAYIVIVEFALTGHSKLRNKIVYFVILLRVIIMR